MIYTFKFDQYKVAGIGDAEPINYASNLTKNDAAHMNFDADGDLRHL